MRARAKGNVTYAVPPPAIHFHEGSTLAPGSRIPVDPQWAGAQSLKARELSKNLYNYH